MYPKYSVLLFMTAVVGLLSCKNNDNVFKTVVNAHINFVNASADTLNFYVNGTRQNSLSSIYPTSQTFYLDVPDGQQNYQFKKAGSPNALLNVPLKLDSGVSYSIYVAGETPDKVFYGIDTLLAGNAPDTAIVRFVNAAPDAGSLTVTIGDTVYFKNKAFRSTSGYFFSGSGQKVIKVYQAGSVLPKIDTIIAFQQKTTYTLFSKGLINGKGTAAFGVGLAINVN